MDYFMIRVMLSVFCAAIYFIKHLLNSKTIHLRTVKVFSSNYSCDQYTHIDNIALDFFPLKIKGQRLIFLKRLTGGQMQFLKWTSTNNNRWSSWLFIVLWSNVPQHQWPGVYTGHSHTGSWQGEGHKQHLKEPCNGPTSKIQHISYHTHMIQTKTKIEFSSLCNKWISFTLENRLSL